MKIFRRQYDVMRRRLKTSDLRKLKTGWQTAPPNFVGVGVPKAGTTWWYRMMLHHPAIVSHRLFDDGNAISKELHFFLHFGHEGLTSTDRNLYCDCFASPEACIVGECSTPYLSNLLCLEELSKAAPNTRVIVLLRNPIDRFYSHVNHLTKNRRKRLKIRRADEHLFRTYSIFPEAMFYSLYSPGLIHLMKYYDRSRILVLQYEKCVKNPHSEYDRTLDFLNLERVEEYPNFNMPISAQGYEIGPLTLAERQRLRRCFEDDVRTCKKLFPEIELEYWQDFYPNS